MIALHFPDGTVLSGEDATDVLARLGRLQWTPCDVPTMKERLSDRAWAVSRSAIDGTLPDDEFLTALDASGLCKVDYAGTPTKPAKFRLDNYPGSD